MNLKAEDLRKRLSWPNIIEIINKNLKIHQTNCHSLTHSQLMQLIAEICFFEPWWLKRMRSTSTKPIEPIAHTFLSSAAHTSQLSANTHQTESRKDTFKPWRLSAIRDNSSLRFWIISPQKMAKTITKKIEKTLSTDLLSAACSYKDQTIKNAG